MPVFGVGEGTELTHSRVKGRMRGVFPTSCSQWNALLALLEAISVSDLELAG